MKLLQLGARILGGKRMHQEIYRVADDYGVIIVSERGGRRILSFDSELEQSYIALRKPQQVQHEYTQVMLLGLVFCKPSHATVLGLGGGGLVHCLHYHCHRLQLQVVELRQAVINVAYEYFQLPESPRIRIARDEAGHFMNSVASESTDVIFSDLYGKDGMHSVQANEAFIRNCYRALSTEGWLVLNFHGMPDTQAAFMQTIRNLFREVYVGDTSIGNTLLFCGKPSMLQSRHELVQRADELGRQMNLSLGYHFKRLRRLDA